MRLLALAALLFSSFLLAGCGPGSVESETRVIAGQPVAFLPDNALIISWGEPDEDIGFSHVGGNAYAAVGANDPLTFRFYEMKRGFHIMEWTNANELSRIHMLGRRIGNVFELYEFDAKALADDAGITMKQRVKDGETSKWVFNGSEDGLLAIFSHYIDHVADKKVYERYVIFDADDPDDLAEAEKLVSQLGGSSTQSPKQAPAAGGTQSRSSVGDDDALHADISRNAWSRAGDDERRLVAGQFPVDGGIELAGQVKLERSPLAFYADTTLYRASGFPGYQGLEIFFLAGPDGSPVRLDGTSPAIHAFNKKHGVVLDAERALHYLWFFTFFVRGEEGPFLIAQSPADHYLPKAGSAGDANTRNALDSLPRKAACRAGETAGTFRCDAVIHYSNAMFEADFLVQRDGMIEMLSDKPLAAELSLRVIAPVRAGEVTQAATPQQQAEASDGLEAMLATPGLDASSRGVAEDIAAGGPVEINRATIPFLSGISQRLIARCASSIDSGDIGVLTRFSVSGASNLMFGGDYSNPDLGKSLEAMGSNTALTALGNSIGDRIACGERTAGAAARIIADSVRANEASDVFVDSCARQFTGEKCSCLAKVGSGVIPDIHRQYYDRSIIKEIIGRNPLLGFQIGMVCGIVNY